MKRTGSEIFHEMLLATSALVASTLLASSVAMASGPTGGTVVVGSATITTPNLTQTVIDQTTNKALINWNSFSVSAGSSVIFEQPNSGSLTVNRVTGPNASAIDGELLANGNIWLINANGIMFGHGSQVNVGALLATTSDLSDEDFRKGRYRFNRASSNPNAAVVNEGTITAGTGGSVVLSASQVSNQGVIQANLGTVVLGGARAFTVDMKGDNLLRYQITAPVVQAPTGANGSPASALVSNSGTISADGGNILLTARAARNVQDNVINNTGHLEATSASSHNGEIILDAGSNGTVDAGGTIDASGLGAGQTGGKIKLTGDTVNVTDGATINASGDRGGGEIEIGRELYGTLAKSQSTNIGNATITADAVTRGNGGEIIIASNGTTTLAGTFSAKGGSLGGNGGFVETSGGNLQINPDVSVVTSAAKGKTGTWLLDPTNIDITTSGTDGIGGSNISPDTIIDALGSTSVELEATDDITVNSAVDYTSANSFSMLAEQNITVNASVQNSGIGAITLVAGWDGKTTDFSNLNNSIFGNNGGSVTVGGDNAESNVAVGSAGGLTMVLGDDVDVDAVNGYAQIGYHGAGNAGIVVDTIADVTVDAQSFNAQIGNGGVDVSGDVGGDIDINAQGNVTVNEQANNLYDMATIGNVSGDATSSQSGNISVTAGGMFSLTTEGVAGLAYLGNWSAADTTGGATGDITLAANCILIESEGNEDKGGAGEAIVGDGGVFTQGGPTGGNINVTTGSLNIIAAANEYNFGEARIANRGDGAVYGNINIVSSGDINLISGGTGTLAAIGNGEAGTGTTSGNITVQSGGNITLSSYGSAQARIGGGAAADTNISVTASGDITLSVSGNPYTYNGQTTSGTAFIGSFSSGTPTAGAIGGNITVTSTNGAVQLFGNEAGSVVDIGNASVAGASGTITVSAPNSDGGGIQLSGYGANTLVFIGNSGNAAAASGDIFVSTGSNLSLYSNNGAFVQIGNSSTTGGTTGNVSGDITVNVGGVTTFDGSEGGEVWFGNAAATGFVESGNVTLITGSEDDNGSNDLGTFINADLGTSSVAGSGGNFTLGLTNEDLDINTQGSGFIVNTPNNLTVLTADNVNLEGSLINNGSGDITVVAGWNPNVAPDAVLTTPGAFGLNDAQVLIGGDNASGNVAVGSMSGTTTVAGGNVIVDAKNGYAQIGFPGSGGTGAIDVYASSTGAPIYNENSTPCIEDSGNVCLGSGSSAGDYAQIGNGGYGMTGSASGAINVFATGNVVLIGGGTTETENDTLIAGNTADAYAMIGNGDASQVNGATVSGNIDITVGGETYTDSGGSNAWIGNITGTGGSETGNVTLITGSASDDGAVDLGNFIRSDLGSGADSGGNFTLGFTEPDSTETNNEAEIYDSPNNLTVLAVGGFVLNGSIENQGTGNITIVTGWDGQTLGSASQIEAADAYGLNGGSVTIGAENATGNVEVGSAGGTTTVLADNLTVLSNNGIAQLGYAGAGSGNIDVVALGNVTVEAINGTYAQIGDSGPNLEFGSYGADISITAGSELELVSKNASAVVQVGNGGPGENADVSGSISITAPIVMLDSEAAGSNVQVGNGGSYAEGSASGDITIVADTDFQEATFADSSTVQIGNGGNNFVGNASGDISITGGDSQFALHLYVDGVGSHVQIGNGGTSAQGDDSGNITIDNPLSGITISTNDAGEYAQIGNGGAGSTGSASGDITLTAAGSLSLVTNTGDTVGSSYIQVGNGGDSSNLNAANGFSDSGNITITASNVSLQTENQNSDIQIGNGGSCAGANGAAASTCSGTSQNVTTNGSVALTGNITINAAHSLSMLSDDTLNGVWIGNGGSYSGEGLAVENGTFSESGNIDVTIGTASMPGTLTMETGKSGASDARIGNGGYLAGDQATASGGLTITGDVTVDVLGGSTDGANATLEAEGDIANSVLIGDNGSGLTNGTVNGTIDVNVDGALNISASDPGVGSAGIGNTRYTLGDQTGDVTVIAQSLTGIEGSAAYDLPGGNVTLEILGDGGFTIANDIDYASPYTLDILSAGNVNILGNIQNSLASNGGAINVLAGWDGSTVNASSFANSGVYGNNEGSVTIGGENAAGNVAVGNASGTTLVEGYNVDIDGENGYAQLGFHGAGGGEIAVNAVGDIAITGGEESEDTAQLGNGRLAGDVSAGDVSGNITGNIVINAGGATYAQDGDGGLAWLGNFAGEGFTETGNLTVVTNRGYFYGDYLTSDLGTGAGSGGNVFIGFTTTGSDIYLGGLDYDSSNSFTWATAGNSNIVGDVQNSGSGAVTLVAGWDGHTIGTAAQLEAANAYGLNGATLTIGGQYQYENGTAVGSASGLTTILTDNLTLDPEVGYAQIGYHGTGGGDIDVIAVGDLTLTGGTQTGYFAQIGNGGYDTSGPITGDITITADEATVTGGSGEDAYAEIGDGGLGVTGNMDGNISLTTTGTVTVDAPADGSVATIGNLGGANASENGDIVIDTNGGALNVTSEGTGDEQTFAQIGNWSDGNTALDSSGDITIDAGAIDLDASGGAAWAKIGGGNFNGSSDTGSISGDIDIQATTLSLDAEATDGTVDQARIGNLGDGSVSGDIDITTTGDITVAAGAGALANIGNVSAPEDLYGNPLQGEDSGNIDIQSGGDISLTAYDSGQARIESGGLTDGTISVTADGDITLSTTSSGAGDEGLAMIGTLLSGTGGADITVTSTGGQIELDSGDDGSLTLIGNVQNGMPGTVSGSVTVTASDADNGNVALIATDTGAGAQIGNLDTNDDDTVSGDIVVAAGNAVELTGGDQVLIGNSTASVAESGDVTITGQSLTGDIGPSIANDLPGGDFTVTLTGDDALTIQSAADVTSGYNLSLTNGGDIDFDASVQNAGTGNITINSTGGNVLIGGTAASGSVAVGAASGLTSVTADNLTIASTNGGAQLGFDGSGGGDIAIVVQDDVTLADRPIFSAQIGNGATFGSSSAGGDITITAGSLSSSGMVDIQGNSAEIDLTGEGSGIGSSEDPLQVAVNDLAVQAGGGAYISSPSQGVSLGVGEDGSNLGNNDLVLSAAGAVTQTEGIVAEGVDISTTSGAITLTNTGNEFVDATLSTSGTDDASLYNSVDMTVAGATVGGTLTLTSGGTIGQSGAITANTLNATTTEGAITLTNGGNEIATATLSTSGSDDASLSDASDLTIAGATVGGDLTLAGGGTIGQSGAITAGALTASTTGGAITLTNTENAFGTATLTTSGTNDASLYDASNLTIAGADVGGTLTLSGGGTIGQSGAITANTLNVTTTDGAITLSNTGNDFVDTTLSTSGTDNASLYNSADMTIAGATIGGTLTLSGGGTIGQSGAITANALSATTTGGAITLTNGDNEIGTATLSTSGSDDASLSDASNLTIAGANVGGDLTLTDGGTIGQSGAISASTLTASTTGGAITLTDAANAIASANLSTGESGDASLYDSTDLTMTGANVGGNLTLLTEGSLTFVSSIQLASGAILAVAGWDGTTAPSNVITANAYGDNDESIVIGGPDAGGNVAVGSASGTTTLAGYNVSLEAQNGYAQLGFNGAGSGNINVYATGAVTLTGGAGANDFAQVGNGGYNVTGNESGEILVDATGNVALDGGAGQEAYAQIGNGGAESNSNSKGYSLAGDVTVDGENVSLTANSSTGTGSYAQIGNGGYLSGQSLDGTATLGGNVTVDAVDDITLTGGDAEAYAQIGNGGDLINSNAVSGSGGTITGTIDVTVNNVPPAGAPDPLMVTAGTGTDSYAQVGNGGNGENTPAPGGTVNFSVSGSVNIADLTLTGSDTGTDGYAQVGNGGAGGDADVSGNITIGPGIDVTILGGTAAGAESGNRQRHRRGHRQRVDHGLYPAG